MPNSLSELHTLHAWEDNQITERCTQGEYAGKILQFKLVDKDGIIDLTNCLVQYAVTRPDKTEDLLDCTIDNGVVKCNLTYSVTSVVGLVHGEVRVIGSNDSGIIKFYGVNLRVYKGVSDEAAEQSDEFTALIAALQKVVSITPDPDSENTYVVRLDDSIVQNGLNPVASGIIYDYLVDNYYTKTQSDDRYYQKSQVYTKAESDEAAAGMVDTIILGEHDSSASLELQNGELVYVATDGTVKPLGDAKDTFYTKTQMDTALGTKAGVATTLAGYGITDGMKYVEIDGNDPTSVDSCTDQNTLYRVYIQSGIATQEKYSLICVVNSTKKIQYAFTRHGFIIFRGKPNGGDWEDWDYLPTHTQVSKAIREAVISGFFGIEVNSEYDKTYNVHNDDIDSYYNKTPKVNDDYEESYIDEDFTTLTVSRADRPNSLSLAKPSGAVKIVFRDTVTQQEWSESVSGSSHDVKNLIPNHPYYYTFYNASNAVLQSGRITPMGQIRMIDVGGDTFNVRDLGGWACDGGSLKYGLIYRGCRLNGSDMTLTSDQIVYLKDVLGIRDEIDLRSDSNASGITDTALGVKVDYVRKPVLYYQNSISDSSSASNYAFLIKRIAKNVKEGKPSYIHCSSGADRTGQLSAIIEAACGVSQTNLDRDYELTSFASEINGSGRMITRRRNASTNADWKTFIGAIMSLDGTGLKDKVIKFLVRNGVTIDEINTLRAYFIDGNPAKISAPYGTATITKTLSNVVMDNDINTVDLYQPFEANLTVEDWYKLDYNSTTTYEITMGGTDITSNCVNGKIRIERVTGNITIKAIAVDNEALIDSRIDDLDSRFELQTTVGFDENGIPVFTSNNTFFSAGSCSVESVKTLFIASNVETISSGAFNTNANQDITTVYVDNEQTNITIQSGAFPSGATIYYKGQFNALGFVIVALKNLSTSKLDDANNSVKTNHITDGNVTETKLSSEVQAKINKNTGVYTYTISASNWNNKAQSLNLSSVYTVTSNTKVDIEADDTALEQLVIDDCDGIYVENNNGSLTIKAITNAPTENITVQLVVYEVEDLN